MTEVPFSTADRRRGLRESGEDSAHAIGVPLDLKPEVFEGREGPIPAQTLQQMDLNLLAEQLAFRRGE